MDAADALVERTVRAVSKDYARALIRVQVVDLPRVHPLSLVVDPSRLRTVSKYLRLVQRKFLDPYVPAVVRLRGERKFRLAIPPVVEEHGDIYAVVDGTHRLKLLVDRGYIAAVCVVVSGSSLPPLPSEIGEWNEVREREDYVSRRNKFRHLRRRRFRLAGAYLRSSVLEYETLREIEAACKDAQAARSHEVTEHWCHKHQRLDRC
jgi:hypothetical protein